MKNCSLDIKQLTLAVKKRFFVCMIQSMLRLPGFKYVCRGNWLPLFKFFNGLNNIVFFSSVKYQETTCTRPSTQSWKNLKKRRGNLHNLWSFKLLWRIMILKKTNVSLAPSSRFTWPFQDFCHQHQSSKAKKNCERIKLLQCKLNI